MPFRILIFLLTTNNIRFQKGAYLSTLPNATLLTDPFRHSFNSTLIITSLTMRLTLLPLVCLLTSAIAAPIKSAKQDTRAVDLAIQHITAALTRLDAAFNNINTRTNNRNEQISQVNEILNLDNFLQSELKTGAGVIKRGANIGPVEALALVTPVSTITTLTNSVTDGWQGPAKKMFNNAGKRDAVLRELTNTKKASAEFSDALVSKLPYTYQYIGTANKASAQRSIQNAIDDYS